MIYLITNREYSACKIGYSADPEKRLSELQTGNACQLRLEGILEGDREVEKKLHKKFASFRMMGEWFQMVPEIVKTFKEYIPERADCISNNLWALFSVCSKPDVYLISELILKIGHNNPFQLNKGFRELVANKSGHNIRTIDNAVTSITSGGFLIRISPGAYKINPEFVSFSKPKK